MKHTLLTSLLTITMFANMGCTSNSIQNSLAQIEQESHLEKSRSVNNEVLGSIQALRMSQPSRQQHHTFIYDLHNKELSVYDKVKLSQILVAQTEKIVIEIAPAKADTKLHQVALSIERAKLLRSHLSHLNHRFTIKFSPKLANDTLNVVTGA